jgi:ribosome maturation factor RimP
MAVATKFDDSAVPAGPRLARETGLAQRVAVLAEPVLEDLGYRLVRARIVGQGRCTVQVMAERPDGTLNIDDCERISRALSPVLDVDDPMPGEYLLEVSSPGVDRPLVRPEDFERWAGHEARIEMIELLGGRRRFRGVLEGFEDGEVRLLFEAEPGTEPVVIGLPFDHIAEARLVMSDRLIRESLKKSAARQTPDGDKDQQEP